MNSFVRRLASASFAALVLLALPLGALAQTVTALPKFAAPATVLDVGNGPTEIKMLTGSMALFTSSGSGTTGVATTASTSLTLTSTPLTAVVPLVGGVISGTGITAGTTITAYNGGTGLTLSAVMTVAAATAVSWGVACPTTAPTSAVALVQAAVGGDLPLYTYARVCAYGGTGPGGQFVTFPIGAH